MDNFLHDFREKVNRAKKPEVQPSDWELFKAYRAGDTINRKPVIFKRLPKKIIAGVAATILLGISLFAYFTFPVRSGEKDLAIEGNNDQILNGQNNRNGSEAPFSEEIVAEAEESNKTKQTENTNFKEKENKNLSESSFETLNKDEKNANIPSAKKYDFQVRNLPDMDLAQKLHFQGKQSETAGEANSFKTGALNKIPNNDQLIEKQSVVPESSRSLAIWINHLQKKNYTIQTSQQPFDLDESFAMVSSESHMPSKAIFQIGGAAHFIVPIEDRIGAAFHTGKRIFASYNITDRLSIGLNWSQSGYSRTIPDKKIYPSLDEINPRSTEDQLEELTVDASFNKAGLDINYDILRTGNLINKIGLCIQRDISAKFDFKMHVRDPMGTRKIQHQNNNIIPKSRYFISPKYQLSYTVVDHINVYANAQYDISLSPFREKYLSFDVGAAYVF